MIFNTMFTPVTVFVVQRDPCVKKISLFVTEKEACISNQETFVSVRVTCVLLLCNMLTS